MMIFINFMIIFMVYKNVIIIIIKLGIFRVGGIFPYYYESGLFVLYDAAASLINRGFFNQDFVGIFIILLLSDLHSYYCIINYAFRSRPNIQE